MTDPKLSRGYRNRNPGNIDWSRNNHWQGQVGKEPGPGGRFAIFTSHDYGIRALAVLLIVYQDRYGLRTIERIIDRWAPSVENDTSAYASHVAKLTGFLTGQVLDLHQYAHLQPLVAAIITHELGGMPYAWAEIDQGLLLAGVRP